MPSLIYLWININVHHLHMNVHWWGKKLLTCIYQQGRNKSQPDPWCNLEKSRTANKHLHSQWFCFAFYLQHRHGIQFKGGVKYLITDWSVCEYCSVYIENTQQTTQRTKTGYTDKTETWWQPCFCKQSEVTHSHCKKEELCQAPPFKGKAIIYPH